MFSFVNMKNSELKKFFQEDFYQGVKWEYVEGRYVTNRDLEKFRSHFQSIFRFEVLGKSVNAKPITRIKLGTGEIKVLAWSQMHGNEATTTKAVFDLLNTFQLKNNDSVIAKILANCSKRSVNRATPNSLACGGRIGGGILARAGRVWLLGFGVAPERLRVHHKASRRLRNERT